MVRDCVEILPTDSEFCIRLALGRGGVEIELEVWGEDRAILRSGLLPLDEVKTLAQRLKQFHDLGIGERVGDPL